MLSSEWSIATEKGVDTECIPALCHDSACRVEERAWGRERSEDTTRTIFLESCRQASEEESGPGALAGGKRFDYEARRSLRIEI